jgi:predicted Mrr-cat superfamily restriction endonuclease
MNLEKEQPNAFILRIAPSGVDRLPEALETNTLIIGWAKVAGLLNKDLEWSNFREIIRSEYYTHDETLRRAGAATGHMWRFIKEMEKGNLVVVPYGDAFYVAKVTGDAFFVADKQDEDSAYRRPVEWLNNKQSIPRSYAKAALISRMKIHGTSARASDLLDDIRECLRISKSDRVPSFHKDLQSRLVTQTLEELRSGRLDSFKFEILIRDLLENLGAKKAEVIFRQKDKGADIVATFLVADTFPLTVAVQAKHWQPDPPVKRDVVDKLKEGMEEESADLGMVVTTGTFSDDAIKAATEYFDDWGIRIELVDGEQFAKMIVEHGYK